MIVRASVLSVLPKVGVVLRALGHNPSQEDLAGLLAGAGETVTEQQLLEMLGRELQEDTDGEELRIAFRVFDREGQVM